MKKDNLKFIILVFVLLCNIELILANHYKRSKIIRRKKKRKQLYGNPPPDFIILPPSPTSRKNLNYCPYYTPKDKEFSKMPIKYKYGISIIITAYKMEKYIKKTLDSISKQTWFKKSNDWEVLIGVDACNKTLKYLHSIMGNYKNLRVFMMEENKGTYITTNTMMSIAKYDNLLRFDADDIMLPNLVEIVMKKSKNCDRIVFKYQNFRKDSQKKKILWSYGQIFIKHWVFDYFGGFMPWRCEGDAEFIFRVDKFITVHKINKILFKKRIHDSNLTVSKKTSMTSVFRKWHVNYTLKVSQKIKNINKAVIITIINDYKEIFSDSII